MHEALARLGAQLDYRHRLRRRAADASPRSAGSPSAALALLADIVAAARASTEADFERVRQLRLHRLTQLRDMPGAVADRAFVRLLYGSHPYGHTPLGTEQALAAARRVDDVRAFHARRDPAVGRDAGRRRATAITTRSSSWPRTRSVVGSDRSAGPRRSRGRRAPAASPARLNVVPRPGAPQSELRIGHVAVARNTPDYHALVAANMVLGGQFVSRINLNLREDKGFTYGARTAFDFRRDARSVRAAGQRADGRDRRRPSRSRLGEIAAIRGPRPVTRRRARAGRRRR